MGVQEISLFEFMYDKFTPKKIRLYQFFAGIGSQAKSLKNLGVEFEDYKIVEWAVPSIKAYNLIHTKDFTDYSKNKTREEMIQVVKKVSLDYNKPITEKQLNSKSDEWVRDVYNNIIATHNLVDISQVKGKDLEIDTNYTNIIFYSFPCQDLSKAGLKAGLKKDSGTRSGLLWEVERILTELTDEERQSCVLICENVPDLVEVNFVRDFSKWVMRLSELGFSSYDQVLNAKDYMIPQNRKRVFMVSLPGKYHYVFPRKIELKYHLKDFLEEKVDEKYYLSQKMINCFMSDGTGNYPRRERFLQNIGRDNQEVGNSVTTLAGSRPTDNFVVEKFGNKALDETLEENDVEDGDFIDAYNRNVKKDVAGTITTRVSASNDVFIAIKNNNSKGYELATDVGVIVKDEYAGTYDYAQSNTLRPTEESRFHEGNNLSGTILASGNQNGIVVGGNKVRLVGGIGEKKSNGGTQYYEQNRIYDANGVATAIPTSFHPYYLSELKIRKLTPKECMRLMGFEDKDTESMQNAGMTDSQIYHCAGDSIVVTVLMGIFGTLCGVEDYEQRIEEHSNKLTKSK